MAPNPRQSSSQHTRRTTPRHRPVHIRARRAHLTLPSRFIPPHTTLTSPIHITSASYFSTDLSASEKAKLRKQLPTAAKDGVNYEKDYSDIQLDRWGGERLKKRPKPIYGRIKSRMDPNGHQLRVRLPLNEVIPRVKVIHADQIVDRHFIDAPVAFSPTPAVPMNPEDHRRANRLTMTKRRLGETEYARKQQQLQDMNNAENSERKYFHPSNLNNYIDDRPILAVLPTARLTVYKKTGVLLKPKKNDLLVKQETEMRLSTNGPIKKSFIRPLTWTTHPYHSNYNFLTKKQNYDSRYEIIYDEHGMEISRELRSRGQMAKNTTKTPETDENIQSTKELQKSKETTIDLSSHINKTWDSTGHHRHDIHTTRTTNIHNLQHYNTNLTSGDVTYYEYDTSRPSHYHPHSDHGHHGHPFHRHTHHYQHSKGLKPSHGIHVEQIISPTFLKQQAINLAAIQDSTVSGQLKHTFHEEQERLEIVKDMIIDFIKRIKETLPLYDIRDSAIRTRIREDFLIWRKVNLRLRDKRHPELGGISRWYFAVFFAFFFVNWVNYKHQISYDAQLIWENTWKQKLIDRNVVSPEILERVDPSRYNTQQAEYDLYFAHKEHSQSQDAMNILKNHHNDTTIGLNSSNNSNNFDIKTHLQSLDIPVIPTTLSGHIKPEIDVLQIRVPNQEGFTTLPTSVNIHPDEVQKAYKLAQLDTTDQDFYALKPVDHGETDDIDELITNILEQQKQQQALFNQQNVLEYDLQRSSTSLLQQKQRFGTSMSIENRNVKEDVLQMVGNVSFASETPQKVGEFAVPTPVIEKTSEIDENTPFKPKIFETEKTIDAKDDQIGRENDEFDDDSDDIYDYDYIDKRIAYAEYYDKPEYSQNDDNLSYGYKLANIAVSAVASTGGTIALGGILTLLSPLSIPVQLGLIGSTLGVTSLITTHLTDITDALYLTTPSPTQNDNVDVRRSAEIKLSPQMAVVTELETLPLTTTPAPSEDSVIDSFQQIVQQRRKAELPSAKGALLSTGQTVPETMIFPLNEAAYHVDPTSSTSTPITQELVRKMDEKAQFEHILQQSLKRTSHSLRTAELEQRERDLETLQQITQQGKYIAQDIDSLEYNQWLGEQRVGDSAKVESEPVPAKPTPATAITTKPIVNANAADDGLFGGHRDSSSTRLHRPAKNYGREYSLGHFDEVFKTPKL